jgi:ribosomal protein S6--L-glutamate ligase
MPRKTESPATLVLGWEEWVALPELSLPAIKVKVDTGARTSALHAFYVEPFGPSRARKVRFGVHPLPRRRDLAIECTARIIDRREVTSSNGEREVRYVIETPLRIGERQWPIEITLANRNMMTYRMLLGRQAILAGMLVDPSSSFLQPKLHYNVYERSRR